MMRLINQRRGMTRQHYSRETAKEFAAERGDNTRCDLAARLPSGADCRTAREMSRLPHVTPAPRVVAARQMPDERRQKNGRDAADTSEFMRTSCVRPRYPEDLSFSLICPRGFAERRSRVTLWTVTIRYG